jgi:hypothetical protein
VRAVAVIIVLLVLGGCVTATTPEAGNWKIERGYDRILGKPSATAELKARSRNEQQRELRYPLGELQLASLQLACFDNAPVVRFEFNHRIGSNLTSTLSYRFDENPGRDAPARFLQTYRTVVIEDRQAVARFVEELRASNKLYVRVVSHVAGTSTVEFSLKGAPLAIDSAYQSCPVDAPARPRTAGAPTRGAWHSVSS